VCKWLLGSKKRKGEERDWKDVRVEKEMEGDTGGEIRNVIEE